MSYLYQSEIEFFAFSKTHLLVLLLLIIILVIILKLNFKNQGALPYVRKSLFVLFCIQQFLLYSWYFYNQNFYFEDALPLYPCRILQLLTIVFIFKPHEKLYNLLISLSIPAASIALLLPDTASLGFPNAVFIQFFLGHSLMIYSPLILNKFYHYRLSDGNLKFVLLVVSFYFIMIFQVNKILNANYAYFSQAPDTLLFLNEFPLGVYQLAYTSFAMLLVSFIFKTKHKLEKHSVNLKLLSTKIKKKDK